MVSSTSAVLRLANEFVQLAQRRGDLGAELLVASLFAGTFLMQRSAIHRALDPNQGAFDAFHGFFEWLTAHGYEGVAEWAVSASWSQG